MKTTPEKIKRRIERLEETERDIDVLFSIPGVDTSKLNPIKRMMGEAREQKNIDSGRSQSIVGDIVSLIGEIRDSPAFKKARSRAVQKERGRKGGKAKTYNKAFQQFMDSVCADFISRGVNPTYDSVLIWLKNNARGMETNIEDCDWVTFIDGKLEWIDSKGKTHEVYPRTLERYVARSKRPRK